MEIGIVQIGSFFSFQYNLRMHTKILFTYKVVIVQEVDKLSMIII